MTITVYSKPACMACNATYRELKKKDVAHESVDMSQDADALALVRELGYQQAPVVVVRKGEEIVKHWSGFDPDSIKDLATPSEEAAAS